MAVRDRQDAAWRMLDTLSRIVAGLIFRVRWFGVRHIPRTGPALLAANHVSPLDPVLIALSPSALGRTVNFLAAAEFFDRPIVGFLLKVLHQIPVRRGAADWQALEELADVVRRGSLAGIFPEGRMGDGDELGPAHRGAARLALAAGVPVIPIGIWGTQMRWPRYGPRLMRPIRPRVTIVFGEPLPVEGSPRDREAVRALTDRIVASIEECLAQAKASWR
jgi:1-acyl-sn-glycerol-3-phosphate acyltransferase